MAPGDVPIAASNTVLHTQAAEERVHPQTVNTSLPIAGLVHASLEDERSAGQPDQAFPGELAAMPEADLPGARINEGMAPPVRTDTTQGIPAERQETPDTPRLVPLSPENTVRLLGRPLPHGTVLLQLHPPDLGHVQVQVRLNDNHLTTAFWAESPEVRALLQTHFPTLQQNLNAQGFTDYQISTTLSGGEFTGQPGQFAQQQAASQFLPHGREPGASIGRSGRADTEQIAYRSATRNGLVDVVI
jgi:hypothetical protein